MTATPTKTKRETWRDWLPESLEIDPEQLLTRDQLLARLKRRHIDASPRDLRYWEYNGALPRPVRQWHSGAVRALYPPWFVEIIERLRTLQGDGLTLEEITPRLQNIINVRFSDDPQSVKMRRNSASIAHGVRGTEDLLPTAETQAGLHEFAEWHERITGIPTDRVEVRVIDIQGNWTLYPFPIADHPEPTNNDDVGGVN